MEKKVKTVMYIPDIIMFGHVPFLLMFRISFPLTIKFQIIYSLQNLLSKFTIFLELFHANSDLKFNMHILWIQGYRCACYGVF